MSIIESLRDFIITCPHIGADQPVLVDYLGTEVKSTSKTKAAITTASIAP